MKETARQPNWTSEGWQKAMANCNNALKFIPNKIRNKEAVLKSLQRKIKEKAR